MNCFNLEIEPIEQFCKYGCKRKVKHEYGSCFDCYKIDYQKKNREQVFHFQGDCVFVKPKNNRRFRKFDEDLPGL